MYLLKYQHYPLINIDHVILVRKVPNMEFHGRSYGDKTIERYVIIFETSNMLSSQWEFDSEKEMERIFGQVIILTNSRITEIF